LETTYHQRTSKICCADSAFAVLNNAFIIRSAQYVTQAETELEVVQIEEDDEECVSKKTESSKLERRLMLKLVVLLYNYQLEKIGLIQLHNVYVPQWSHDAEFLQFESN
jgi:hypothetical protein